MLTFGSIGCGNMGGAILSGVAKLEKWQVIGFDPCRLRLTRCMSVAA